MCLLKGPTSKETSELERTRGARPDRRTGIPNSRSARIVAAGLPRWDFAVPTGKRDLWTDEMKDSCPGILRNPWRNN